MTRGCLICNLKDFDVFHLEIEPNWMKLRGVTLLLFWSMNPRRDVVRILQGETKLFRLWFSFPYRGDLHFMGAKRLKVFLFVSQITVNVFAWPSSWRWDSKAQKRWRVTAHRSENCFLWNSGKIAESRNDLQCQSVRDRRKLRFQNEKSPLHFADLHSTLLLNWIAQRNDSILIPTFAFGLTQEVLTISQEAVKAKNIDKKVSMICYYFDEVSQTYPLLLSRIWEWFH
jgi:hypothetical protein